MRYFYTQVIVDQFELYITKRESNSVLQYNSKIHTTVLICILFLQMLKPKIERYWILFKGYPVYNLQPMQGLSKKLCHVIIVFQLKLYLTWAVYKSIIYIYKAKLYILFTYVYCLLDARIFFHAIIIHCFMGNQTSDSTS